jgi:hypothetical protein
MTMDEVAELLAVGEDGSVNKQPLLKFNIRYDATSWCWRRITLFHIELPSKMTSAKVARTVGAAVGTVQAWEAAMRLANFQSEESATSLLRVNADGTVNLDPLSRWNFRYHPRTRVWRRSRARRDEVPRTLVARRVGVPAQLIEVWEKAADAAWVVRSEGYADHAFG